jgi:hypothetical protein
MDELKNVALVPAYQLSQLRATFVVALVALGFAHRAVGLEGLRNLVVQLPANLRRTFAAWSGLPALSLPYRVKT